MLEIKGNIASLIQKAHETDSVAALIERIDYLQHWGENAKFLVQTVLTVYGKEGKDNSLQFFNKNEDFLMSGGLVHHVPSNTWNVHT